MLDHVAALGAAANLCARAPTWPTWRVERLKELAKDNELSASQIGLELGVTRNAVIGKLDRLGLSIKKNGAADKPGRTPKTPRPPGTERKRAWRALVKAAEEELQRIEGTVEHVEEVPEAPPATAIASLFDLRKRHCKYPIGDPGTATFCYCGAERVAGLPYCAGHARKTYRPWRRRH